MSKTLFEYCQKMVIFRNGDTEVLLARRKGEADYDGVYSFVGGKAETTDGALLAGLEREKNEELGKRFTVKIISSHSWNAYFVKNSGTHMVLPHHYAVFVGGEVDLSAEYSDYVWVPVNELDTFEPKIPNIPEAVKQVLKIKTSIDESDFTTI